jgi:hypothetical protein
MGDSNHHHCIPVQRKRKGLVTKAERLEEKVEGKLEKAQSAWILPETQGTLGTEMGGEVSAKCLKFPSLHLEV